MSIATESRVSISPPSEDLERIFREQYGFVHRTAHRVTGNAADAEDVLQTLFLRLFRRELAPDMMVNPKAYLYRAAVNIALDMVRSRRRHAIAEDDRALADVPATAALSAGEEELNARLRAAIAELNPKAAHILLLRHVHGYTDVEIARLLGTSRGSVAVSLFRSRARLRKSIRRYSGETP